MIRHILTAPRSAAFAAAVLAGIAPALAADGPTEPSYTYSAEVADVVDGDTVDVNVSLGFYVWIRYQRIHLAGIEAPDPATPAGAAATKHLEDLIGGKTVILQSIHGDDDPDRSGSFGNWLGLIWLDGKSINDEMIASGNATKAP